MALKAFKIIIIYQISGTDPTKETHLSIYWVDPSKLSDKVKDLITDQLTSLHQDGLDNQSEPPEKADVDLLDWYAGCLRQLEAMPPTDLLIASGRGNVWVDLPYNPINPDQKLTRHFNEPGGALFAVDYYSSYDYHYYLEITEASGDNLQIDVHEH